MTSTIQYTSLKRKCELFHEFLFCSRVHTVIMDKTDEEILKNDPELANLFTDDEDGDEESTHPAFNFGRSRTNAADSTRRSQSAKLG